MAEIINLRRARKARDRAEAARNAEANRARFGRTKAERAADAAERDRQARTLDGAKRGDDDKVEGEVGDGLGGGPPES